MLKTPRLLLVVAALLLVGWLNYAPFWNPDEGRYAAASLEMMGGLPGGNPDWVVPHLNTIPRLNKPPLIYWLAGGAFSLFGPSEWAGRIGPALAALGVMLIVFALGRAMFGEKTGIAGALIWSTSLLPAALGRTCNTDMLLCFGITVVLWGIWIALAESETKAQAWRGYLIAGLGIGVAILSKGPAGVALPLIVGLLFLAVTKRWRSVNWAGVVVSLAIGSLIALPWFIALEKRQPGFTYNFLIAENLGRFSGSEDYHDPTPLWFYVPVLLVGLVPWTAFVGTAVAALRQRDDDIKRRHARWFLWIWAFFIIIFFSKSSTKLFSYILPSFPALALLLGDGILSAIRPGEKSRKGALVALLLINVLGAIGAAIYLLDGKTMPRPTALPYAVSTTLILGTAAYFGWKFWRAGEAWKVVVSQFACAVAFYVCLLAMAQKVALYEDSSSLLRALRPHLKPSDEIILTSSFSPTAIYYARRPIYLVNFKNNSGLEEKALEKSPYFIKMEPKYLKLLLQRRQRTFVMLRWRRKDYEVPPGVYTWARNNDFKLICNQPPDDYRYDYTAPKKAALDTDWRFGPPPDS